MNVQPFSRVDGGFESHSVPGGHGDPVLEQRARQTLNTIQAALDDMTGSGRTADVPPDTLADAQAAVACSYIQQLCNDLVKEVHGTDADINRMCSHIFNELALGANPTEEPADAGFTASRVDRGVEWTKIPALLAQSTGLESVDAMNPAEKARYLVGPQRADALCKVAGDAARPESLALLLEIKEPDSLARITAGWQAIGAMHCESRLTPYRGELGQEARRSRSIRTEANIKIFENANHAVLSEFQKGFTNVLWSDDGGEERIALKDMTLESVKELSLQFKRLNGISLPVQATCGRLDLSKLFEDDTKEFETLKKDPNAYVSFLSFKPRTSVDVASGWDHHVASSIADLSDDTIRGKAAQTLDLAKGWMMLHPGRGAVDTAIAFFHQAMHNAGGGNYLRQMAALPREGFLALSPEQLLKGSGKLFDGVDPASDNDVDPASFEYKSIDEYDGGNRNVLPQMQPLRFFGSRSGPRGGHGEAF